MTVSGKDKRGLVEEIRTLRTRLDKLERRNAELVQAEKELRQFLEQFKTIFEDSPLGLYRTAPDGRILMANSAVVKMLGYSSFDELARRNLESDGYEPQYSRSAFKERIEREGKVVGLESIWKKSDGTTLYIRESAQAVRDEGGNTLYYQGTVEDITERKQAEEALRKAHDELEKRVQERTAELQRANEALQAQITECVNAQKQVRERARIIDSTTDSVIKTDRDGVVTMWNRGAERIFGYTSREMIGQPVHNIYPEQERGRLAEIIETLLRGEEIATAEVTCVHKNGSPVELALSLLPLKDDSGNVTDFVGISKDITEHKKIQEALRQSESRYRTVIENAGEAIVVVQEGMLRFVNPGAIEIMGYSQAELMSRPFIEFIHPDDRERVMEIHTRRLKGEEVPPVYEFRIIDKDGQTRWLQNNGVLIEWDGKPASLNFLRDITAHKKTEEALKKEKDRAQQYLDIAAIIFVAIDADGKVFLINKKGSKLLGYDEEEIVGKDWFGNFVPERPRAEIRQVFDELMAGQIEPVEYFENPVLTKWAGERLIAWHNTVIRDEAGNITATLSSGEDITERRQAEEALRETTGLLETIFAHTHILVAYLDSHFNFVRVNRAYAEADGREPSFFVGRNHFELYPNAENEAIFRKVVEIGVPYFAHAKPLEYAGHPERGVTYWDWSLVPIKQQNGEVSGLVLTLTNVTEQKRAEQALRESEERFRKVFEEGPIGMVLTSRDMTFFSANPAFCKMLGYTMEEMSSKTFLDVTHPAHRDADRANVEKMWRGEIQHYTTEKRYLAKNGNVRWGSLSTSLIQRRDGKPLYALVIVEDITERKLAEEAVRESEAWYRAIFQTAMDGYWRIDMQGRLLEVNETYCRMSGYSQEELLAMSIPDLEAIESPANTAAHIQKIIAQGHDRFESKLRRKDGTIFDIEVSTQYRPGEGGWFIGFSRDITERKKAQQKLLDDREQLKSLASQLTLTEERERRRLATVLHDHIGQSLVFSKIKLDQMRQSGSSGELTEALNDVSRHLGRVIQDTRTLTFDLSDPILYELGFEAAVAEWLMEQVQEKHGIETEFQDDGQAKPLDDDIRMLLFRNVREVLINIIKHAKARHVKVAVGKADKYICVSVQDDGAGFDPVEVAAKAAKRAEFGLFSIRERLEQLGGRVEIESKAGRGTKITMIAPLKYERANDRI